MKSSPVKFIRNIDLKTSFFSNLKMNKGDSYTKDFSKALVHTREQLSSIDTQIKNKDMNTLQIISEPTKESANVNAVEKQQKVIRNFTFCAEYEENFKNKNRPLMFDDDDELDYEEDYDDGEYIIEQQDDANSMSLNIGDTTDSSNPAKPDTVNYDLNLESSKKFKYVTYMLLKEIRISVYQVKVFW